jgi:polyvinyl alcohol dehydrogenase (cytochrome)
MRRRERILVLERGAATAPLLIATALVLFPLSPTATRAQSQQVAFGATMYRVNCASCHDDPQDRTPPRSLLASLPPEAIVTALLTGVMKTQGERLGAEEIHAIALFLTGKAVGAVSETRAESNNCDDHAAIDLDAPQWNGWGRDLDNSRYQPSPGLAVEEVPKLKLKWAFGYPGIMTYGQPTILGDRLFVSSMTGRVFSLNARTGCTYWSFDAGAGVRTAISIGAVPTASSVKFAAYFADEQGFVYAVDAVSGKLLWQMKPDEHRWARIIGAPALDAGRLYVPVSSPEEAVSRNANYPCCTFRGNVSAIDAATGKLIWKAYAISEPPQPFKKNAAGTQMYGPAGAAIWSAPTIDRKRNVLYVGTGNSYTEVETNGTDAILAIELETGGVKWIRQFATHDDFLMGCGDARLRGTRYVANCPSTVGPDFDFGSSPILRTLPDGKQVVLVGQKSGMLYALDPDDQGKVLWQVSAGKGSALGGIEWGPAADEQNVYVAISDVVSHPSGGLTAFKITNGERIWHTPAPPPGCTEDARRCTAAQSAAVTVIPGVVFSGSQDGHLRAYASGNGSIVWDYDTRRPYETVNGMPAHGGSLDTGGPTIANGMLFVNSGYGKFFGEPGNVLLALSVDGR